MTGSATRLTRLLALVPYLLRRPGVSIAQAAKDFAISEEQLVKDLELLFMCGLPGGMPDDLIDAHWEDDQIYLANADTISRPLRLGVDEALALMVGLRMLAGLQGLADRDAINRTIAKLERAAGEAAEAAKNIEVEISSRGRGEVLATCTLALTQGNRLHLRYYVPTRDEITERDVDPMRIVLDGVPYLEGWCHRAEDVRLFRLDRIQEAVVLDEPAKVPDEVQPRNLDDGLFQPSVDDTLVTMELDPAAHWVVEYYQCEWVEELPDGERLRIGLRTPDTRWVARLVLRLGGAARIVAPVELADRVRDQARAALAQYGD